MEMTIDELMQIASSRRWTVWTVSMIPGTAEFCISSSPLCTPDVETLYLLPVDLIGENELMRQFVGELNRAGGWPPEVVDHQARLLRDAKACLPKPTVSYVGEA